MTLKKDGLLWKIAYAWRKVVDWHVKSIPEQSNLCQFVHHLMFGFFLGWPIASTLFVLAVIAMCGLIAVLGFCAFFFGHYVSPIKGANLFVEYPLPSIRGVRILPIYPLGLAWIIHSCYTLPALFKRPMPGTENFYEFAVFITGVVVGVVLILAFLGLLVLLYGVVKNWLSIRCHGFGDQFQENEFVRVWKTRIKSFKEGTCVPVKFE